MMKSFISLSITSNFGKKHCHGHTQGSMLELCFY
jgi:hypothetical protein